MAVSSACVSVLLPFVLVAPVPSPLDLTNQIVQTKLQKSVERILPSGWSVTKTRAGVTPSDWETNDSKAGFLVEGNNGNGATFQIFILPRDWIGIRRLENQAPKACYWEGILVGETYKTIAASTDKDFQACVQDLFGKRSMSTASLNDEFEVAMEIFKSKGTQADETAQALINEHCNTADEFEEAAHSLISLGVPAKRVFMRGARETRGIDRKMFFSALGLIGDDDAIGLLCDIVSDARMDDEVRELAARYLWPHSDKRIGPALHKALKELRDENVIGTIVGAEALLRYEPAAPDLLAALKKRTYVGSKVAIAEILAALKYKDAIPEIEKFQEELRKDAKAFREYGETTELALLRLKADWGKPSKELRLLIVPPKETVVGEDVVVRIYTENIGAEVTESFSAPEYGLRLDGKRLLRVVWMDDPPMSRIRPGKVMTDWIDLSRYLKKSGTYKLQYVVGDARSAEITIRIVDPK
jgi:hypothetical protein